MYFKPLSQKLVVGKWIFGNLQHFPDSNITMVSCGYRIPDQFNQRFRTSISKNVMVAWMLKISDAIRGGKFKVKGIK